MDIREAVPSDNIELQQLQERCPQGTTLRVSTVNKPDFFARAKVYEDFKVYVTYDKNRIIGSAACGLRKAIINNQVKMIGHEFQVFIDPDYRGRRIAGQLHQALEEYIKKQGAILSYALIMEGNKPSVRHFERQGFKHYYNFVMPSIAVFKEMPLTQGVDISIMMPEDLPAVVKLINDTWKGYEFYEPMTEGDFDKLLLRIPEYDFGNVFLLKERGEIKACLGYWDWSKVTKVTVEAFSMKMRMIVFLLNLGRVFKPMPHPPVLGNLLKQIVLTPIGYKDLKYLTALLRHMNNWALSENIEQIFFICKREHHLLNTLKGFIHIDTTVHLYTKPLNERISLLGQPIFINGLDL